MKLSVVVVNYGVWSYLLCQWSMVEGSWQKNYMKENILYGIPTPSLEVHGDNNLVIIATACCEEWVLTQELLLRKLNRTVWKNCLSRLVFSLNAAILKHQSQACAVNVVPKFLREWFCHQQLDTPVREMLASDIVSGWWLFVVDKR